ncbi:flagellar M-ring protein FliF [Acidovorax sp. Leaf76]|uniref:flagellar basal-body MS-ring/collar protein FliF n=1 Tax=unclassified Acidovorax TaxID=2684926 RepID=UPI0006F97CD8|nr:MULTISPECIES: flagellar basal-body MS-ring/collar protein FliF [unclassified Acidovorax]KQO13856.1 flagellar M-ring protein FliF [Acidovorax sp. Leaf76]KQO31376.1 flagellar M-ring protein FliF [Acidovorax sp. Leaf84]KQS27397.1 flagellar M-ring protein FliF [Acidovorax sp. Leaf191]
MSAVAEIPLNPPASPNWLQRLSTLDRAKRMRLGVGVALLVAVAIAAIVLGRQPDYRVLFANLSDKDGGAIVAQLSQMNVPYKYADGGGAILIPSDRVHDVRLRLATQGLPKGSVTGFELMESSKFGMTQFQERLNFQRGLEGELTRSIQALSSVQGARVHLALPNQNGFFREQQKPSASVLVSLHPGRILDRAQLAGIVHLVASSVPELSPSAVSVLDDTGKLLSQSPDGGGTGTEVNAQQLLHVQQLEQQYTRRIMDILEPVVGRNNVKAQVTAEVDFTQTESTSEQFRPNQTPDSTAIRSQQVLESKGSANKTATGVPGAVSNQPPAPTTAPVNGANPAPTAGNSQQGTEEQTSKRESTTNFEVDKTVRVTRGSTGNVKRLSAAVVVNYQTAEDKGKPITKALTPEQLEQMTALVRETIGFNKERGDSVNLMNTPFLVDATPVNDTPLWKQPEVIDLAKTFAWPVGAVLFAALVLLGLVRPALKSGTAAKPQPVAAAGGQLDALESETPERPALPAPNKKDEVLPATPEQLRLDDARVLAKENPVAVANILKSWLNGDPA